MTIRRQPDPIDQGEPRGGWNVVRVGRAKPGRSVFLGRLLTQWLRYESQSVEVQIWDFTDSPTGESTSTVVTAWDYGLIEFIESGPGPWLRINTHVRIEWISGRFWVTAAEPPA